MPRAPQASSVSEGSLVREELMLNSGTAGAPRGDGPRDGPSLKKLMVVRRAARVARVLASRVALDYA